MAQNLGEVSQLTAKKFRVLLAEGDSSETASSLRALFPEPSALELSAVTSFSTLIPTIELAHPEVVFFDLSLGRPDPLSAVRRLHRSAPGVPLIVIADAKEKGYASLSLKEGAIDYLFKGYSDPPTLERVLRSAMEHNTLEGLADLLRDSITGLYNRDGFVTLGGRAMDMAMRSGGTLVLLGVKSKISLPSMKNLSPAPKNRLCAKLPGFSPVVSGEVISSRAWDQHNSLPWPSTWQNPAHRCSVNASSRAFPFLTKPATLGRRSRCGSARVLGTQRFQIVP